MIYIKKQMQRSKLIMHHKALCICNLNLSSLFFPFNKHNNIWYNNLRQICHYCNVANLIFLKMTTKGNMSHHNKKHNKINSFKPCKEIFHNPSTKIWTLYFICKQYNWYNSKGVRNLHLHSTFINSMMSANDVSVTQSISYFFKGKLHPNETMFLHHLKTTQDVEWNLCCSQSLTSYGFIDGFIMWQP
jgi:hypothetical protein